jgi:uncharacterized protein YndB with AHSA1/START domain
VTLPTDTEILITREFDAPRNLVFRAWTEPELIRRWWSGQRGVVTSAEVDLRVGGAWRYAMRAHSGAQVAFHGEFRELVPGERIVSTEVFEGMPDGEALNIITFGDLGERSVLELLMRLGSREERDMVLATGMEDGVQEGMDLLEQVAIELA